MEAALENIRKAFFPEEEQWLLIPYGNGLINNTWKVQTTPSANQFILQKINESVFKNPMKINDNVQQIGAFLKDHQPDYFFVRPLATHIGHTLLQTSQGYFRLQPFVANTHTVDVVPNPDMAFEAAREFGTFSRMLHGFDAGNLQITLPGFHNLTLRYDQFQAALHQAPGILINSCREEIKTIIQNESITDIYKNIDREKAIPLRVIHHDTKISNVLFDHAEKGVCVIDLDTVMPGYFISDVGDMCRTYLCAVDENATDLNQVSVRVSYFEGLAKGYLSAMKDLLTPAEKDLFTYSGQFMIYMQAIRFLTDHLLGNIYYPVVHPLQNLERTKNQLKLLKSYQEQESTFQDILNKILKEQPGWKT